LSSIRWPVDPFLVSVRPTRLIGTELARQKALEVERQGRTDLGVLARGTLLGLVAGVGSSVFGFVLVVVISRGLHPVRRAGVLFEAMALFLILSNTAELGADTGLVRMLARYRALGRTEDLRRSIGLALWPVMVIGALIGSVVFGFAPQLARLTIRAGSRSDGVVYIRLFALAVPLATSTIVALSGSRAFGTMLPYTSIQGLGIPALRPVALLAVIAGGLGTLWIGLAYVLPLAIGFVAALVYLFILLAREERRTEARSRPPRAWGDLAKEFWLFSSARGLAVVFQVAVFQLDILLVGGLRSAREAGIYAAVSRYVGVGTVALQGLALAIAPQISAFLARKMADRARRIFQAGTTWLVLASWPLYMAMIIFAPLLMRVFGHGFVPGAEALAILAAAGLVLVGTGNNKVVLLMGGGSAWNLMVTSSSLIINVGLNLVLIPRFGMNGAALAYAASILYDNSLTAVLVWRLFRLHPFARGYWVAIAGATLCYGLVGLIVRQSLGMTVPDFLLFGVVATALYGAFLWLARQPLHLSVIRDVFGRDGVAAAPAIDAS
jgi:O-antigen/teichoic acid export membrane protein